MCVWPSIAAACRNQVAVTDDDGRSVLDRPIDPDCLARLSVADPDRGPGGPGRVHRVPVNILAG